MKATLMLISFFFVLFHYEAVGSSYQVDSALINEREFYLGKVHSIRDTMTVNSWINLKRLSDNLEKLAFTDAQILDSLYSRIKADSATIAALSAEQTATVADQSLQVSDSGETGNNRLMPVIMKAFIAFLLFLLLILVYLLIRKSNSLKASEAVISRFEATAAEKQSQVAMAELELTKLKQREFEFREELERGIQLNQERMQSMLQKCELLEEENRILANRLKAQASQLQAGVPEDAVNEGDDDDRRLMIRSLMEERSSLMNLAATLRAQLADETRKRQTMLEKFRAVYDDINTGATE
ncbi:MAG: hypothetical protein JNL22_16160 [Bacteroidales bacterium]|nr:hypothetical protein [Bacteroidales bacterium]